MRVVVTYDNLMKTINFTINPTVLFFFHARKTNRTAKTMKMGEKIIFKKNAFFERFSEK